MGLPLPFSDPWWSEDFAVVPRGLSPGVFGGMQGFSHRRFANRRTPGYNWVMRSIKLCLMDARGYSFPWTVGLRPSRELYLSHAGVYLLDDQVEPGPHFALFFQ